MRFPASRLFSLLFGVSAACAGIAPVASAAGPPPAPASDHARIVAHWTPERMAAAIPRDFVIDERGQGYLRKPDGSLEPYGQIVAASVPAPKAKPTGPADTTGPEIKNLDPADGATVTASSYTFEATVTDAESGVRSVSFNVGKQGALQAFNASRTTGDLWVVSLQGFTDGNWVWNVVAKNKARITTTSDYANFKVSISGGGGGGSGVIANAEWTGGDVQNAAGRIYFEMPGNRRLTSWAGYVCSGTVVTDSTGGHSIIQTAAHCVYDDSNKAFARNVMFIPNQANTSGSGTDLDCSNDPLGCWTPTHGVVDANWTTRTFPDNVRWDYAYYVVPDDGRHDGAGANEVLDSAADSLPISFDPPQYGISASDVDYTHALGYSYNADPRFMYCAEDLAWLDDDNWWLGSCGLSGGSSGGPWIQPMNMSTGSGPLISVNSWGYTTQPGMAGPKLFGTTAACVFALANSTQQPSSLADGRAGLVYSGNCGN